MEWIFLIPFIVVIIGIIIIVLAALCQKIEEKYDIGNKLPYHPRILNWVWARLCSYFWLPCPLCGKNFGGHEWRESLWTSCSSGTGVCPKCMDKAKEMNKQNKPEFDLQMQQHYQHATISIGNRGNI